MRSKFLTQLFTDTPLTLAGLILFFCLFNALIAWVYLRQGAKQHYHNLSLLPLLEDGDNYERR